MTYRAAFPRTGREVIRWLRAPDGPMAGLLFLPYSRGVHGRKTITGMQRVRRAGSEHREPHSRVGRHCDDRGG